MGYGAIIAGVLGAGANIAGGILGQADQNPGSNILPSIDPNASFPIQAANFDSLAGIGLARPDLLLNSGPINELIGRINGLPLDEKTKRRALIDLNRIVQTGSVKVYQGGSNFLDREAGLVPSKLSEVLSGVLARLGLETDDILPMVEQQAAYEEQIRPLIEEYGSVQPDVVRDRLNAQADIASISAGALRGESSPVLEAFRDRMLLDRQKALNEAEERATLQGQFGGFNPSARLEQIDYQRGRLDTDVGYDSILQAIGIAGQVSSLLNAGTAAAQGQAGIASQSNFGALTIAANQANAANQLNQQLAINNSNSAATAGAGAINSLGQGFLNQALLNRSRGGSLANTGNVGSAANDAAAWSRSTTFI